jgi:hypothetical protein
MPNAYVNNPKKYILIAYIVLSAVGYLIADEKMYVFYPTKARPQVVQDKLQKTYKNVMVTVFGRYIDFIKKIEIDPPTTILTKPKIIDQIGNYGISLNGYRDGTRYESYMFVTLNKEINTATVTSEMTIGVIDILGRKGMKEFVGQFFQVQPKIKRVTKLEDLLPLLSFNMVEGILVEKIFIEYFKSTSKLNFNVTALPKKENGIISLGTKQLKNEITITKILKDGNKEINELFNVDQWK